MKTLVTVVNQEQQKEVLNMLSNFETQLSSDDCRFPLFISFNKKQIFRTSSITVCAVVSQSGCIVRDYQKTKDVILEYLQEQEADNS